jgi:hypothetical protein
LFLRSGPRHGRGRRRRCGGSCRRAFPGADAKFPGVQTTTSVGDMGAASMSLALFCRPGGS